MLPSPIQAVIHDRFFKYQEPPLYENGKSITTEESLKIC
jgi:hypothetical protein